MGQLSHLISKLNRRIRDGDVTQDFMVLWAGLKVGPMPQDGLKDQIWNTHKGLQPEPKEGLTPTGPDPFPQHQAYSLSVKKTHCYSLYVWGIP